MGLNKKINIENLKENRAVSEAREKLRDDRTRGIVKWVFEIIVTLVFCCAGCNLCISDCDIAGKCHGTHVFCK